MELDVVGSTGGKNGRNFLRLHRAAGLEAGAEEIELGFGGGGRDEFEKRNRGGRLVSGQKDEAEIVICF